MSAIFRDLLKLARPHQWVKNGFVLLGTIFSHRFDVAPQTALAFAAFCAAASAVYVFNDIFDIQSDRNHPVKRNRPLASGRLSKNYAWIAGAVLTSIAISLALEVSKAACGLVILYGMMNIFYSVWWKNLVIIDVFTIAAGFMIRILVGTIGLSIAPSSWLLLCGMMVTLFLGFSKRRAELLISNRSPTAKSRKVLASYSPVIVDQFQSITAACTILSYALYTVSQDTVALHGSANLIYTVPFIVYGIFRYLFLLHAEGSGEDTAKDIILDWHLRITVVSWIIVTVSIIR
jgi:4-hydroxybenzoate polyprenyltransferase